MHAHESAGVGACHCPVLVVHGERQLPRVDPLLVFLTITYEFGEACHEVLARGHSCRVLFLGGALPQQVLPEGSRVELCSVVAYVALSIVEVALPALVVPEPFVLFKELLVPSLDAIEVLLDLLLLRREEVLLEAPFGSFFLEFKYHSGPLVLNLLALLLYLIDLLLEALSFLLNCSLMVDHFLVPFALQVIDLLLELLLVLDEVLYLLLHAPVVGHLVPLLELQAVLQLPVLLLEVLDLLRELGVVLGVLFRLVLDLLLVLLLDVREQGRLGALYLVAVGRASLLQLLQSHFELARRLLQVLLSLLLLLLKELEFPVPEGLVALIRGLNLGIVLLHVLERGFKSLVVLGVRLPVLVHVL